MYPKSKTEKESEPTVHPPGGEPVRPLAGIPESGRAGGSGSSQGLGHEGRRGSPSQGGPGGRSSHPSIGQVSRLPAQAPAPHPSAGQDSRGGHLPPQAPQRSTPAHISGLNVARAGQIPQGSPHPSPGQVSRGGHLRPQAPQRSTPANASWLNVARAGQIPQGSPHPSPGQIFRGGHLPLQAPQRSTPARTSGLNVVRAGQIPQGSPQISTPTQTPWSHVLRAGQSPQGSRGLSLQRPTAQAPQQGSHRASTSAGHSIARAHRGPPVRAPSQLTSRGDHPVAQTSTSRRPETELVKANHFKVTLKDREVYHYNVAITQEVKSSGDIITQEVKSRRVCRSVISKWAEDHRDYPKTVYDGRKILYTVSLLPLNHEQSFKINLEDRTFDVVIEKADSDSLKFGAEDRVLQPELVQALNIILMETPSNDRKYLPLGQSFYFRPMKNTDKIDLGGGVDGWQGFYQSIRQAQSGLTLNVDVSATAFIRPTPIVDFLATFLRIRIGRTVCLSNPERMRLGRVLGGVKVRVLHRETNREYRVCGVTSDCSGELSFVDETNTSRHTVTNYFLEKYRWCINCPSLPCLEVGNPHRPQYLPMEVCTIADDQWYAKKLDKSQITKLREMCCKTPNERQEKILKVVKAYSSDHYAQAFGVEVSKEFVTCTARLLPPPQLSYPPNSCLPHDGAWHMGNNKFVSAGNIECWACVNLNAKTLPRKIAEAFCDLLVKECRGLGMNFSSERTYVSCALTDDQWVSRALTEAVDGENLDLLLVILPDADTTRVYGYVKRICETELGVVSQCCLTKTVRLEEKHLRNMAHKINVKVGGRNTVLAFTLPKLSIFPTVIFGADVTHPSPGDENSPSIAAVVASQDWPEMTKYVGQIRAQGHRKEIIEDLESMVKDLLESFQTTAQQELQQIIFYRDGVSEAQFEEVRKQELTAIQNACKSVVKSREVRVTFVVVQKRHHTRLFRTGSQNSRNNTNLNVRPGTAVDSTICHPDQYNFYLCSHLSKQGTSRPAHYHVLCDDIVFTAEELQTLTNDLCYTFARCTQSLSIVPPARYAHLLAARARTYVVAPPPAPQPGAEVIAVQPLPDLIGKVKNAMFFC